MNWAVVRGPRTQLYTTHLHYGAIGIVVAVWLGVVGAEVVSPWLTALDAVQDFEIVSIADRIDSGVLNRSNLLSEFPLKVRILGLGQTQSTWRNLNKLTLLAEYISQLPSHKIVMVLDLFDVVWFGCQRDLVEAFKRFGKPLVFSAEFEPYPLSNASLQRLPGGYPILHGQHHSTVPISVRRRHAGRHLLRGQREYRYLNSGCFVGYVHALKRALNRMLAKDFDNEYVLRTPLAETLEERTTFLVGKDDQVAWHAYALKHRDEVALDYGAELFLNVFGFVYQDFEHRHGRTWVLPLQREICFAHGNGASNIALHLLLARKVGIQPWKCHDAVQVSEGAAVHFFDCDI